MGESFSEQAGAKYHISPVTLFIFIVAYILFSPVFSGEKESFHLMKRRPYCELEICEAMPTHGQNALIILFFLCTRVCEEAKEQQC